MADSATAPMAGGHATNGFTVGGDEKAGAAGRTGKGPLPHIDDLTTVPRDIDMSLPIRKMLELAESAMRQAEAWRDFHRPDLAFKEYITASIIAIKFIPRHHEYISLKNERPEMQRTYAALMKKIGNQHTTFEKIKADIIEDNRRTGVRPKDTLIRAHGMAMGQGPAGPRPQTPSREQGANQPYTQSATSPPTTNGASKVNGSPSTKPKPMIQPKPQALHGNAIKPGATGPDVASSMAAQDLAARFANLRTPKTTATASQDPRIKTHTIVPARPAGPRAIAPPEKPVISVESSLPDLPKVPDAIYSPARGTVSNEAAQLPSSTPRGLFSRTGSFASGSGSTPATTGTVVNTSTPRNSSDYFTGISSSFSSVVPSTPKLPIPGGDTITVEDLFSLIQRGAQAVQVLIIDVRSREVFDEGHIMSQSTICIEPSILVREDISAEQIAESMVLSPAPEQFQFEKRNKFDLVVICDQSSEKISQRWSGQQDEVALMSLQRALVHLNYGRELKMPPKLLKGGVDAWVDMMGPLSLQTSSTAETVKAPKTTPQWKISSSVSRTKSKYTTRPLKPEEVKVWEETLKHDDLQTSKSPGFVRSTEDFLRRFPAVSLEQESMTSPVSPTVETPPSPYGSPYQGDIYSDLPSPPTRPAPAVPRPSYSGLSQNMDDDLLYAQAKMARVTSLKKGPMPGATTPTIEEMQPFQYHTGLHNPHNWCYANSSIQALLSSPGFGQELQKPDWQNSYKVPRTADEKIDHPQLMTRILSNLFHYMGTGKLKVMKAETLMVCIIFPSVNSTPTNGRVELF
jgi:ubiquitin carboxyl-terminal hydrolase 8